MKRFLGAILAGVMACSLFVGCGSPNEGSTAQSSVKKESAETKAKSSETRTASTETKAESATSETVSADASRGEGKKVTALFFSLEGEFFNVFDSLLRDGLTELGYEYTSQSSNNDPITMIEQMENAVAGGTDLLWIWPTNGEQIADACRSAMANGTLVYTFVEDPGEDARNVFRGSDSAQNGIDVAEMAIAWADENYGKDAADGSIRTLILTNEQIPANKLRGETCIETIKGDPRFEIVEIKDCEQSVVAAQSLTENLFAKYGDTIDCVISWVPALGVLAYLDSETCVVEDPERLGIFSTECNEELASYMRRGLYDGTLINGGNPIENAAEQVKEMDALMHGEMENGFSAVDSGKVTVDNLEEYGY